MTETYDMCIDDFMFYAIYEQTGFKVGQDGVIGLAPHQTGKKKNSEGPLLLREMKKAKVIDRAVFSFFISDQHAKHHSLQIGDYDTTYVQGGETNLHWYSLTVDKMGWRWQTDLTAAHLGGKRLFTHDFKWVEINPSYAGIGLTSEDFDTTSKKFMDGETYI